MVKDGKLGKHGEKLAGVTPAEWSRDYVDYTRDEVCFVVSCYAKRRIYVERLYQQPVAGPSTVTTVGPSEGETSSPKVKEKKRKRPPEDGDGTPTVAVDEDAQRAEKKKRKQERKEERLKRKGQDGHQDDVV